MHGGAATGTRIDADGGGAFVADGGGIGGACADKTHRQSRHGEDSDEFPADHDASLFLRRTVSAKNCAAGALESVVRRNSPSRPV
jgi:hypothetical protein